jgi:hypothetical protein
MAVGRNSAKKEHDASLIWWFLFDYTIPVFCIVVFWPVAAYLHDLSHAYERTFYGADLIPLSSVLILGVVREVEMKNRLGLIPESHENIRSIGLFLAMILLAIYAILRFYVMKQDIPADANVGVKGAVTSIATFSLVVVVAAGAFCFWLKSSAKPHDQGA